MRSKTEKSVCPFDCPDACGLLVTVEDGQAVKVCGDPDHPVTKGFVCSKMQHYERSVHSPLRLVTPLRRTGPKGGGEFEPVTWKQAIEEICSKWRKILAEFGGESILPYSYAGTMGLVQRNAGHSFFHRLGASRLARTICSPAKEAGWMAVMGETPAMDPACRLESDLFIIWGQNPAATSIHTMADSREVRRRGGRVWAIDTYKSHTCEAVDEAFIIRPGSDGALALGMLNHIVSSNLADLGFIEKNVLGFEEFKEKTLADCTPEKVSPICGLAAETICRLAEDYASALSPFIQAGGGLARYGNSAMNIRCITCLPAVTGAWEKGSGGLFCGTSTGAAFPLHLLVREDFMDHPTRVINMNRLGDALNRLDNPPVKALYVYHSNPASIAPDQNSVIRGLMREDLFTVVHERFMTDTARYADIVLPATSSLEHPDIYRCYGNYHAQRCSAVIPPIGQARSNWDTFHALAEGMGWDEPFFRQSSEDLIELLIGFETPWRNSDITGRLRQGEPVLLTPPSPAKGRWLTPSGMIEIKNDRLAEPIPRLLPTHANSDRLPLRLQPAVTPHALNSSFYERDDLREKQGLMDLMINPEDASARSLSDGDPVIAFNCLGEVLFNLRITDKVPAGTVVTEGVWWSGFNSGRRGVNALTSQRLTDLGEGSTLYDVAVDVRKA